MNITNEVNTLPSYFDSIPHKRWSPTLFEGFGSTNTLNSVSTQSGFCDQREVEDWGEEPTVQSEEEGSTLACLVSALQRSIKVRKL